SIKPLNDKRTSCGLSAVASRSFRARHVSQRSVSSNCDRNASASCLLTRDQRSQTQESDPRMGACFSHAIAPLSLQNNVFPIGSPLVSRVLSASFPIVVPCSHRLSCARLGLVRTSSTGHATPDRCAKRPKLL